MKPKETTCLKRYYVFQYCPIGSAPIFKVSSEKQSSNRGEHCCISYRATCAKEALIIRDSIIDSLCYCKNPKKLMVKYYNRYACFKHLGIMKNKNILLDVTKDVNYTRTIPLKSLDGIVYQFALLKVLDSLKIDTSALIAWHLKDNETIECFFGFKNCE